MAQLVARLVRNEKVGGSNPPSSTTGRHPILDVGFLHALGLVGVLRCLREGGLRVKMCVWLGVSRGLDLAFLNAD